MLAKVRKVSTGRLVRGVIAFVVFTFLYSLSAAYAQTEAELREESERLANERAEIEEREGVVQEQIGAGQQDLVALTEELEQFELKVNRISNQVSSEQAKLNDAQNQIVGLENEAEAKNQQIEELRQRISDQAITGYQISGAQSGGSVNATDQLRMQSVLDSVTTTQAEDVEELNDLIVALEQEKAFVQILEKRVSASKEALEKDRAELASARDEQQVLVDQADAIVEARLAEAAVLADRDADLAAKITENTDELAARAARRASASSSSFASPTAGEIVTVQGIAVHVSIAENLDRLLNDARAAGVNLAGWGYRDSQRQIELRMKHCGTSQYAIYQMSSSRCSPPTARPGASQHERGLAIDFTYNGGSIGSRYNSGYRWLASNASSYGLYNLPSEPWHWSTTGN